MAQFKGTIKEFTKYIGAYARIKVTSIASMYKRTKKSCEVCGATSALEIAHVKGKERPVLIAQILSEFMDGENSVDIDLNEFEERFIYIHFPLESTVRILCTKCHRDYDKKLKPEQKAKTKEEEGIVVERLASNLMNKGKALKLAHFNNLTTLNNANTIFSNLVGARDRWWLEPRNEKFKDELNIILNDDALHVLNIFHLPANTISTPATVFNQRNDNYRKDCSDIYVPYSNSSFKDSKGFDFTKYLVRKIEY